MYNHKTELVTGSSSGIGLDIARGFYKQGANLVLNGHNKEKLILLMRCNAEIHVWV
ncbi:MAG: SDR family NAD(P)-dependent oxidoreductase [Gammaproteobacteria bacterium]|nr:SDR family NAD(P)-dependent oxidoreductase [Gammaproteobacteria bacterium]